MITSESEAEEAISKSTPILCRASRFILTTLLVSAFAVCASASDPETTFDTLCREEAGTKIFRRANRVENFVDSGFVTKDETGTTIHGEGCVGFCLFMLTRGYHKFVEAHVTPRLNDPFANDFFASHFVPGPGLYRFWLEQPGHPDCRVFQEYTSRRQIGRYVLRDLAGRCVASRRIVEPTSRYEFLVMQTYALKNSEVTIYKRQEMVRDLRTKVVMAQNTSFRFAPVVGRNKWCPDQKQILPFGEVLSPR